MVGLVYIKGVSTLNIDKGKCTGCSMCINVCPHAVLGIENKKAFIEEKDRCMECGACQKNCASHAITVTTGVGCAAAVLTGIIGKTEPVCGCSDDSGASGCC